MDIRQAILKAADHIESHPSQFSFLSCDVPSKQNCGTPGCALGWIATFIGADSFRSASIAMLGHVNERDFYRRMNLIEPLKGTIPLPDGEPGEHNDWGEWTKSASICARTMRLYADKYHPAKTPDWQAIAAKRTVPEGPIAEFV